jgi:hippurate hydrolase
MQALERWLEKRLPDIVALRRDIHAHPELSGEEARTAALVAKRLRAFGVEVVEGVGGHGVIGVLHGEMPGDRRIGLRADMDALPILEASGLPHASTAAGKMHACGHDGHTAMLVGAAEYLAEHRAFAGTVVFIFQPAEEVLRGAAAMISDGLFERFPCDAVFGLHNAPELPVGRFAIRDGAMFAAADFWTATFHGRGGHGGAEPHLAQDVIFAQAQFVTALQGIIARHVPPHEPAVISIGHVGAGVPGAPNVIPSTLRLDGSLRCRSEEIRLLLEDRIRALADATASVWGCSVTVDLRKGVGPLVNHPDETRSAIAAAAASVGRRNVDADGPMIMASEDFAFMLRERPGAFIALGALSDGRPMLPLHTPQYDFNDESIPYGVCYWANLVERELQ